MNVERSIRRRTFLSRVSGMGMIGLFGQGLSMTWSSIALAGKPKPAGAAAPMIPLGNVTVDDFVPLVGSVFQVGLGQMGTTAIMLVKAEAVLHRSLPGVRDAGRPSFSLIFEGPASIRLPQQTYRFQHHMIGVFDMFLVPIGPHGPVSKYEAIFG